jgi:hypothetical protein
MSEGVVDSRFKSAMTEMVGLKAQLSSARKDLHVLSQREKELREFVKEYMSKNQIDTCNVKEKVKVSLKMKKLRSPITKDVIVSGLRTYFAGDDVKVEGAFQAIVDSAPIKESSVLAVTGLKAASE